MTAPRIREAPGRRATGGPGPVGPLALALALALALEPSTAARGAGPGEPPAAGGAAESARAAEAAAPLAAYSIAVDREASGGPSGAVVVAGTTDAPEGARVTVTLAGVSHSTGAGAAGDWRIEWPLEVAPGSHEVRVAVMTFDGRRGEASAQIEVVAGERLPRRSLVGMPSATRPEPGPGEEDFKEHTDRWRLTPPPYELDEKGGRWNPYEQNVLKGDLPIRGDDLFFVLTAVADSLVEGRELPTPAGVSTAGEVIEFFGDEQQEFYVENVLVSTELFKGDTAFKPFDWRFKATLAGNLNYVSTAENAIVKPDVRRGTNRRDDFFAVQELFFEVKLADLSPHYDFVSLRVGVQPFNSDFRGFIFDDVNLGVRLFGNLGSNRNQFNLAYFERLEKDTNSGLNTLELRDQQVAVASYYRQDFLVKGYTTQVSLHYLRDEPSFHFDENEFLARPDPAGDLTPHEVEALYVGWTSFGHVGRINVDSAVYYVTGEDSLNPLAGRRLVLRDGRFFFEQKVDVEAWMAALELSIDRDWLRPRIGFFVASGDDDLADRDAEGFDSIFDKPAFAGGGFSFWNRMGIRLAGTGVTLVNRGSLLPNLRSSKEEGQPNFVNPGVRLGTLGLDAEVTPKIKTTLNVNYLEFDRTEVLEGVLFQGPIDREIGWDLSAGLRYRPYLNQNFVILAGVAVFLPGKGFEQIFEEDDPLYQAFTNVTLTF